MAASSVQTLLGAVRRRLWRGLFISAARQALWGSAAFMLLAVAVHLAARPVPAGALQSALALLWVSMMAWAGSRRPGDLACALWADRHLGAASVLTTLLETGKGSQAKMDPQALRWVEHWAADWVPDGQRLLAEHRESTRLPRSILAMLVCAALATFVLALPDSAPPSLQRALSSATSLTGIAGRAASDAGSPAAAELAGEIAGALRSAASRDAPERVGAGQAAGPGKGDHGPGPVAAQAGTLPSAERAIGSGTPSGAGVGADATPDPAQSSGAGSGREAGDGRDGRVDDGSSPAPRGARTAKGFGAGRERASTERQVDLDQWADYDEEHLLHRVATARVDRAAAAAIPPAAAEATGLTPAETGYVQAWTKASARQR